MSQESFPLCMTSLNHAFRQNHHLRHWGRMQYGLFLKAIGLSLDEAMRFWRAEFTKAMDGDKVLTLYRLYCTVFHFDVYDMFRLTLTANDMFRRFGIC